MPKLAQEALSFVRRGGTLMIYGVYANDARVSWSPEKIFADEINVRLIPIINSFNQSINLNFFLKLDRSSALSRRRSASRAPLPILTAEKSTLRVWSRMCSLSMNMRRRWRRWEAGRQSRLLSSRCRL